MKRKIFFKEIIAISVILCYSFLLGFISYSLNKRDIYEIGTIIDPNANDVIDYELGISYGAIDLSHQFYGELIKVKETIFFDAKTELYAKKYDILKKGDIIGKINNEIIYSTFNGIVLDIEVKDTIKMVYQNFDKTYCLFDIDIDFFQYFDTSYNYIVFIDQIPRSLSIASIDKTENEVVLTTDYFYFDNYMSYNKVYLDLVIYKKSDILRIENRYLTNKIGDNQYILKIYNPNLFKDRVYEVIIDTGIQNEKYTEITSNNVFPYEAIIQ